MTSTDIAPTSNRQQPAKIGRQVARAIEAMVWEGHRRDEAAKLAGMLPKSLYNALRKASVKQVYLREIEVLRTSGRARRVHRLEQLAEQDDNKQAAINAIRALDYIEDEQHQRHNGAYSSSPGLVIVVNGGNVTASHALPNAAVTERDRQQAIEAADE